DESGKSQVDTALDGNHPDGARWLTRGLGGCGPRQGEGSRSGEREKHDPGGPRPQIPAVLQPQHLLFSLYIEAGAKETRPGLAGRQKRQGFSLPPNTRVSGHTSHLAYGRLFACHQRFRFLASSAFFFLRTLG